MRIRRRWVVISTSLIAVAAWLMWLNACATSPLRVEPVERRSGEPVVDADLELARRYAPWVLHEVHATGGRQDLPAPIDFDGNWNGDDNWESFPRCELVPTLSYAHVETATHHFLTWHVFHPRDWEPFDVGLHMTHEGDGENLQVVVDKATQRVVLLYTQAHYEGIAYANEGCGFADGERELAGPFQLVDDVGRPSATGTHAVVFVESKGHGIYGSLDPSSRASIAADGSVRFERQGLVLRPARAGELVAEPTLDAREAVPYRIESTTAKCWPGVRDGSLVGAGRAFDGAVRYDDARVALDLPKYHRGDRFSGPLGSSRGISPFAVDFGWSAGTIGALFFDPAARWADQVRVPATWSREYVDYPFTGR